MNKEKVLTWLEICGKNNDCSGCCPYSENGFGEYGQCRESLMADAYDLLKEQCAVKPKSKSRKGEYPQIVHKCGNCNQVLYRYYKYCPSCGKQVKWQQ